MYKIDHVGIAVNSLAAAVPIFAAMLGENPAGRETVPSESVDVVFFGKDAGRIELLEPTDPQSPVARFLDRRGQGLHHLCFRVTNLEETLERLARSEIFPIPPGVRPGAGGHRVAFIHPRDCGGVLVELVDDVD